MSPWDYRRGTGSVRLLADIARERALAVEPLLAAAAIDRTELDDPQAEISALQEWRFAGALVDRLAGLPYLGLDIGRRYRFSTYGLWGYGLLSSHSAQAALALALRYLPLTYAFTRIRAETDGAYTRLVFEAPDGPPALCAFLVERDLAAAAQLMSELVGADFRLVRLRLRLPPPAAPLPPPLFGATPEYGAAASEIAFASALLLRPLPAADALTAALCEQLCATLLERRRVRTPVVIAVRRLLAESAVPPRLAALARTLRLSERGLKRRLQQEGTSYRQLLETHRRALAARALADGDSRLTDIAERLGFADLSSFSQAYKRWHGVAPSRSRAGSRAGAPPADRTPPRDQDDGAARTRTTPAEDGPAPDRRHAAPRHARTTSAAGPDTGAVAGWRRASPARTRTSG